MTINGPAPIVPAVNVHTIQNTQPATEAANATPPATPAVHAPDGVDPNLWQMLTPEEQSFFANQSVLGPLTYGPVNETTAAEAPRGQRIDVRA